MGDRSGAGVFEGSEVCLSDTGRFLFPFGAFSLPPEADDDGRVGGGVGWPLKREKSDFMCMQCGEVKSNVNARNDASVDVQNYANDYASVLSETLSISPSPPLSVFKRTPGAAGRGSLA